MIDGYSKEFAFDCQCGVIQQADLEDRVNLIFYGVFLIATNPSPILKANP